MPDLLYARRDTEDLCDFYFRHVLAMTAEGLHEKNHIAAELAWRDAQIAELRALVSRARELAAKIGEAEKRENEARDLMHDGGPMMPWEEKGPLIKRCGQACNEAREARRELLAMFAEGK